MLHIPHMAPPCSGNSYSNTTDAPTKSSESTTAGSTATGPLQPYIPPWVEVLLPAAAAVQKSAQVRWLWGVVGESDGYDALAIDACVEGWLLSMHPHALLQHDPPVVRSRLSQPTS